MPCRCPVSIGQARVAPGDLLRGDADGVLVIPQEHELRVLDAAEEIAAVEDGIRHAVREGSSLRAARERFRYHQLQTRERLSRFSADPPCRMQNAPPSNWSHVVLHQRSSLA